jgi:hypothetical protein
MKNAPEGAFLLAFGGVDVIKTVYIYMSFLVQIDFIFLYNSIT